MSIISTTQALPNRILAVYRILFASKDGELRSNLEAFATPLSLSRETDEENEPATTLLTNTLQEARRLGMIEEVDSKVRLTPIARGEDNKDKDPEKSFRKFLRAALFDRVRAEETRQLSFMLALAWLLSKNPLAPLNFAERPTGTLQADLGDTFDESELTSLARYQNFLYWARYMGFATIVGWQSKRYVIPDPMRAIAEAVPSIFDKQAEIAIDAFLERLNAIYPVFVQGKARQNYGVAHLPDSADADQRISIATSVALQRLADRQIIRLSSRADARARILDFGVRQGRVSYVALGRLSNA